MTIKTPPRDDEMVPDFVRALPEDGAGRLALFDADGTLWRDDVADDFASWMLAEGHFRSQVSWDEYIRVYRDDHAAGCEYMLRFYAGLPLTEVHARVDEWWHLAARNWILEAVAAMRWLGDHGYAVWVVTGSPTDTMRPLLEAFPVERILGMDFALDEGGVITGELDGISCADQGKADKVRSLWEGGPIELGAGNGSLDAAMIELGRSVRWSVYPNPSFEALSRANGWHVLGRPADFVEEVKLA